MQHQEWWDTVAIEVWVLKINSTWDVGYLPIDKKAIGCRWVYKIKYHIDRTIEHYKAHLIAKGYSQTEGINYTKTFSHVTKITTTNASCQLL